MLGRRRCVVGVLVVESGLTFRQFLIRGHYCDGVFSGKRNNACSLRGESLCEQVKRKRDEKRI